MSVFLLIALVLGGAEKILTLGASVCYENLGCFSNDAPFASIQRPISLLPFPPIVIQTHYWLYSRENTTTPQILDAMHPENAASTWTHFQARRTQILVHGFLDNPSTTGKWLHELKDELLQHGDYNVIIVDWSRGNWPPYSQAAANARVVGAQISRLVTELIYSKGVTAADFHIIGHSLGAHVSGYAGERIPNLSRLSGLDPAGPYFEGTPPIVRLDPTDAQFVDVIHTDSGTPLQLRQGIIQTVGHADFFPNLGYIQPGCGLNPIGNIFNEGIVNGLVDTYNCNHLRATKYYVESVNSPCQFTAYPCASEEDYSGGRCGSCTEDGCSRMGFHADQNLPPSGHNVKYYLWTSDQSPFCLS